MESRGKRLVSMCVKCDVEGYDSDSSVPPSLPDEYKEAFNTFNLDADDEYLPSEIDSDDSDAPLILLKNRNVLQEQAEMGNEIVNPITETNNKPKTRKLRKSLKGKTRAAKSERKYKRNHGGEYMTESGKIKQARMFQDLSNCRMKCRENFRDEDRKKIFEEYWGCGSHAKRVNFVSSLIRKHKKFTSRQKDVTKKSKNREFTHNYYLRINGIENKICKECFRKTLGETNKFLELCSYKVISNLSGIYQTDRRGKQPPKNKYGHEDIMKVTDFIHKVPLYESHYSRRDTNKKYLPPHYTITKLYNQYLTEPDHISIKRTKFEEIFRSLNIGIKRPSKDTCGKCDKLKMKITLASGEEKVKFQEELNLHLKEADDYYNLKSEDKRLSKNDPTKKIVTFDLQQCLPTPQLTAGITFYLRQLWTFNLTVHDCDDNQAYCFMWHEAVAGRGANQIASCLYNFLLEIPRNIEEITLYSDSCSGQNKNSHVIAMYFALLKAHPTLKIINHKFLIPGHTHMECDGDHALIEKTRKRTEAPIHHPHDWYQLVRCTGKKHPFKVIEMTQLHFLDFAELLKTELQVKKKDESGDPFYWRNVREIKVNKNEMGHMFFKTNINGNFKILSFRRRGSPANLLPKLQYNGPIPISKKKKDNLMQLLPYISNIFWDFYKNLPTVDDAKETHPDLVSSDEED